MEKYFCCPECGSKRLQLAAEKKPFSWAKAIIGSVFLGVLGILFGFLGQDNITVSSWRCGDCKYRFEQPTEARRSVEKNEKAFDIYFQYSLIIILVFSVIYTLCWCLIGVLFSVLFKSPFLILFFIFADALCIGIILVPYLVFKYFVKKIISSKKEEIILSQEKMKKIILGNNTENRTPTNAKTIIKQPKQSVLERDADGLWHLPDEQW